MADEPYISRIPNRDLRCIPVPLEALVERGLSPSQWVICYLLHYKMWDELNAYILLDTAPGAFLPDELNDLHGRFYLIYEPIPGVSPRTHPSNFRVSERFTDLLPLIKPPFIGPDVKLRPDTLTKEKLEVEMPLMADVNIKAPVTAEQLDAFDELFQHYPSHIPVDGKQMSGRSGDYDQMSLKYAELLKKSPKLHAHILELVDWAVANNLITMGLNKFLHSREWLGLEELRAKGFQGGTYDNADVI